MTRLTKLILTGSLCFGLISPLSALAGGGGGPGGTLAEQGGVFDENSGSFFIRFAQTVGAPDLSAFLTSTSGFIQISGDWDGDGVDGIGVFSTTTGGFFLVDDVVDSPGMPLAADYSFFLAPDGANWLPIAGNWNGTGGDGVGIYNTTSGAMFLVNDATETSGAFVPSDLSLFMVTDGANWIPIAGGWAGGAADGVGVYNRTSGAIFLANDATGGAGAVTASDFGLFMSPDGASFIPVSGDWNDNGSDGVGIFSTTSGSFFVTNDVTAGIAAPTPADVDWFIQGSASPLGGAGIVPVTGFFATPPQTN